MSLPRNLLYIMFMTPIVHMFTFNDWVGGSLEEAVAGDVVATLLLEDCERATPIIV
eukprot:CAMPEP_0201872132 /NCGR_PEP_ID=MMETSP0902-20130614/4910_2 /ASSEMBLY_ACC=CAM_ASM_000551 /TAXON_ID=420261 /ORGANISM="Thalassiosira antarctica, Strain CCMP982" /LENGTH=55 /DNA_ID=CAMNT_0048398317 /DNA_START=140 /DNA_END=304 /DNA_ORIENTATION=-